MSSPRSYLFVPGDREERFEKAAASGAHEIIIDLEDAVGPDKKEEARAAIARWFANGGKGAVRMNAAGSPWFDDDLALLNGLVTAKIMVAKAEAKSVQTVARRIPDRPLIALVETVEGLVNLRDIATTKGVQRLAFGHLDFCLDARMPGVEEELNSVRFQLAIQSRHAGLDRPIDGVTVVLDGAEQISSDVARAKNFGFGAKLCIHPKQVTFVNQGFAPSVDDVAWANRVVDATKTANGAVVNVDGKMVDRPVVELAMSILADAEMK